MTIIITTRNLSNVLLPVAISGFIYLLNRRSKRLSKKNKKILKILLISSIAIYGYVNFSLIASLLKIVLRKLKNQKTVENIDIDSKNYQLPRTKKIVLALTVTTLILVVIIGFKYFSEPMDEVAMLIKEVEGVDVLTPELSERVNKYLLKSSDERMAEIENNWQQELETLGKELETLGNLRSK